MGFILGMKEMVYMSQAVDLVKQYGATFARLPARMAKTPIRQLWMIAMLFWRI